MNAITKLPPLLPLPHTVRTLDGPGLAGRPRLVPAFTWARTPRLERAVQRLLDRLGGSGSAPALPLLVDCEAAAAPYPGLEDDESYTLAVTADGVRLGGAEWGVLRGLATLAQLFGGGLTGPLAIDDAPRFRWRGLMLDVARHFIPAADLLRTLDAMELVKLNVLHLHLSDDQAFRFPSRRYPRLAAAEHYTREELERLVAAAADRGIRVVPELDVPGHVTSWLLAHPEWGNRPAQPSRRFGVHRECLDPTDPQVLAAVAALFGELAEVFPDPCLHMGGDEVHPEWWSQDERIQAFMQRHGLGGVAALQAHFQRRVALAIDALGRRPMGWDEVLHPQLPACTVIQAWRGVTARDRALAAGHDCVLSAPYYLDLFYPAGLHYGFDPAAPEQELLAREDALERDPRLAHVAAGIAWTRQWREERMDQRPQTGGGRLLGGEACLWSELVDARLLDLRLWGRLPAVAERFWSAADCRDEDDLYRRLEAIVARLPDWAGVDPAGDAVRLQRAAGLPPEWQPLADALEPVKWYGRLLGEQALAARLSGREMPLARPYDADSPLDRVVDALPPESPAVRRLTRLLAREAAGDPDARAELFEIARTWAALPAVPAPAELEPLAARLRVLGGYLEQLLDGSAEPGELRAAVAAAAEPVGDYLLAAALVLEDRIGRGPARPRDG